MGLLGTWCWRVGAVAVAAAISLLPPKPASACICTPRRELRRLPESERPKPPEGMFRGRVIAKEVVTDCTMLELDIEEPAAPPELRSSATEPRCVDAIVKGACGRPLGGALVTDPRGRWTATDASGKARLCGLRPGDELRFRHAFASATRRVGAGGALAVELAYPQPDSFRYTIAVTSAIRGARRGTRVQVASHNSSCGIFLVVGRRYRIVARRETDGTWWTAACTGTRALGRR